MSNAVNAARFWEVWYSQGEFTSEIPCSGCSPVALCCLARGNSIFHRSKLSPAALAAGELGSGDDGLRFLSAALPPRQRNKATEQDGKSVIFIEILLFGKGDNIQVFLSTEAWVPSPAATAEVGAQRGHRASASPTWRCRQTKLVVETLGEEGPNREKDGAWEEEEDAGLGGNARKKTESLPWALCHFMSPPEHPWHIWNRWGTPPASKAQARLRALIPAVCTDLPSLCLTTFIVQ